MNKKGALFAIATCLAGCGDDPVDEASIVIGSVIPIDISAAAKSRWQALKLAIDDVNASGVFAQPLTVVNLTPSRGDSADPNTAAEHAKALHDTHGAVAVVSIFSSLGEAIIGVTNSSGYDSFVQCNASGTRISLNDASEERSDKNDTFYRTVVNDSFQGALMSKVINEQGWTKVGVYWLDDAFGSGLRSVFLSKWGGMPAYDESFPAGDFVAAAQKTKLDRIVSLSQAGDLDVIVVPALQASTAAIVAYLTDNGYVGGIMLSDGGRDRGLFAAATGLGAWLGVAGNVLVGTAADGFGGKNSAAFRDAYVAAFMEEPNIFAPTTYDCGTALAYSLVYAGDKASYVPADVKANFGKFIVDNRPATAVEAGVGSMAFANGAQVIKGGGHVDYQGASGRVEFDASGDRPAQGMETYGPNMSATDWITVNRYDSELNKTN